AFIPPANQRDARRACWRRRLEIGQFLDHRLPEQAPLGRQQNHGEGRSAGFFLDRLDRPEDGFRLENHPRSSAERAIVHAPVWVVGEIPQIVNPDFHFAAVESAMQHSVFQNVAKEIRKNCNDIKDHGFSGREPGPLESIQSDRSCSAATGECGTTYIAQYRPWAVFFAKTLENFWASSMSSCVC